MEDTTLPAYMDGLYAYGMMLSRNPAMAADLVQETYLRALKAKEISCAMSAPGPKLQSSIRTRTSQMCPLQLPKIPTIST
jgi:DNA-directed RNA polymerase specialized sigma24 family protein